MRGAMVVCTKCGWKQFLLGVSPRRQTREEMERDLGRNGKVHAICSGCKQVSCLKAEVKP